MQFSSISTAFVAFLCAGVCHSQSIKSLYIFKDPATSNNTAIKTTGFNSVMLFAINIQSNGDLVYPLSALGGGSPDVQLTTNGVYIGGSMYADLIKGYKAGVTDINRVEATLSGADNIKSLIDQYGTGSSSPLYKSVAALKAAWNLDAANNDDESLYDVDSTVEFAKMLGNIGYKYTAAPYTNINFWSTVIKQINTATPGLFDRAYLQCYDGGQGNSPGQWISALGIKVVPLLWVTNDAKPYDGTTAASAKSQFQSWYSGDHVAGGGYWNNYDIEKEQSSYVDYANALNDVFG